MATRKITGVYAITNNINGKIYAGQSVNIYKRWEYYKNKNNKDTTPIISAIRKYGVENFTFEVVELCTREELNALEIHCIAVIGSMFPCGYNLSTGGQKTTFLYKPSEKTLQKRSMALTGQKRTEETKVKMSAAQLASQSPEKSRKLSEALRGKVVSAEQRLKISNSLKGNVPPNKGIPMSDETKAKVSAAKTGITASWKFRPVIRNDGVVFESLKSAAQAINATYRGLIRVLNGERKRIYGWSFEYFDGGAPSQL